MLVSILTKNKSFGAEYIAGYRINPKVRLGVGTGVSWVDQVYEERTKDYNEDAAFVPAFLNGKFNFTNTGVSPFFNINVGYSIFVPCSEFAKNNKHTMFFNPSFGVDLPLSEGKLNFEIGYKYQLRSVENALVKMGTCNYSQLEIAIGYQF